MQSDDLVLKLDLLCESIYQDLKYPEAWIKKIKDVQEQLHLLHSWSPQYIYKDVEANGFLSIIRFFVKYLEKVSKEPGHDTELGSIADFGLKVIEYAKLLHNISIDHQRDDLPLTLIPHSVPSSSLILKYYFDSKDEFLAPIYGRNFGFWLSSVNQTIASIGHTFIVKTSKSYTEFLKYLYYDKQRGISISSSLKNITIEMMYKIMGSKNSHYATRLVANLWNGIASPNIRKTIFSERQSKWKIKLGEEKVIQSNSHCDNGSVECLLIANKLSENCEETDILLFCHGGAYIGCNASSCESVLRNWVNRVSNLAVVSIEYSLAPKKKFPVQLQEVLDVYLWILNHPKVLVLENGLKPNRIILAGDSAGGHLMASLVLVLNDIRNSGLLSDNFLMPTALLVPNAPFSLKPFMSSSFLLSFCESFLTPATLLNAIEAYSPLSSALENKTILDTSSNQISDESYHSIIQFFRSIFSIWTKGFEEPSPNSWFLCSSDEFREGIANLDQATNHGYIDLLNYKYFNSLDDVNLHLIVSHFDPVLDQNVEMAKLWKGPITFDLMDDLPHSFLSYLPFCPSARKANDFCVQRIKESLVKS